MTNCSSVTTLCIFRLFLPMIQTFLDQTQRREAKTIKYRITFANHLKIDQTHLIEMCSI